MKEKAHVNVLKEPVFDSAALEKTVDSALLFVFGKHVLNPSGCPQPKVLGAKNRLANISLYSLRGEKERTAEDAGSPLSGSRSFPPPGPARGFLNPGVY